jgi:hypothetical protein
MRIAHHKKNRLLLMAIIHNIQKEPIPLGKNSQFEIKAVKSINLSWLSSVSGSKKRTSALARSAKNMSHLPIRRSKMPRMKTMMLLIDLQIA